MAERIALTQGAYTARDVIAAVQRSLNLYSESNPRGEDSPTTHYLTPGLSRLGLPPQAARARGLYRATNGQLYAAVGTGVYFIAPDFTATLLFSIASATTPVKFNDNATTMVVVDGSANGWAVDMSLGFVVPRGSAPIVDPNFFGGNFVEVIDTFFLFNKPGTNIFYSSPSNYTGSAAGTDLVIQGDGTVTSASYAFTNFDRFQTLTISAGTGFTPGAYDIISVSAGAATLASSAGTPGSTGGTWSEGTPFDPLYFAAKTGYSDYIGGLAVQNREIWVIGSQSTTEIWVDEGTPDFPFGILSGPFIEHATSALYSIAETGGSAFFLAQNAAGQSYVMMTLGLTAEKISTPAIEAAIGKYPTTSDAVGFCYEQLGHAFYWLKFPTQGVDWVYDLTTKLWHERGWLNPGTCEGEGHRAFCAALCYGLIIVGDRDTGQLYMLDPDNPMDAGAFIERRRGYPHMMANGARATYPVFEADMRTGTAQPPGTAGLPAGLASPAAFPAVTTVIDTSFAAPNGTLLQDYFVPYGLTDVGSQYTEIISAIDGEIENDTLTGSGAGATAYLASGVPTSPDYICQFQAVPSVPGGLSASGTEIYIIGRANASNQGYQLAVTSDGARYHLVLTVMGGGNTTVAMGVPASGGVEVYLSMQGTELQVAAQRSVDGLWLTSAGTWRVGFVPAITDTDGTYATAGNVIIGGTCSSGTALNIGSVAVNSLLTESPCTVASFAASPPETSPSIGLRYSDTRGSTWGNGVPQPLTSDPESQPRWNRNGYARDRVFELFWSFAFNTALNGALVTLEAWKT